MDERGVFGRGADEDDVAVFLGEALGFLVYLGDQWTGGVDGLELTLGGLLVDGRRDPVRGEDDDGALGHLLGLLHEDRAALLEGAHDVRVVHDLLAHVDRGAVLLQGLLDGDDRSVDTGAVSPGVGE